MTAETTHKPLTPGTPMGYVCAFRGRRDSYQVPVALAEAGKLDRFITDHYCGLPERLMARLLPQRFAESVRGRFDEGLPETLVTRLTWTAAVEAAARLSKVPAATIFDTFDPRYGVIAAREARRLKSNLLMYSPYAHEAFSAPFAHSPRKVLFQYHPHFALENAILKADRTASKKLGIEFSGRLESIDEGPGSVRLRADSAWQIADQVLCASAFTKRSLVEADADPAKISVVPYGVHVAPPPVADEPRQPEDGFHALFVGSGLQRKGLHHLVLAWQRARLPAGSRLTVVARVIDPGLVPLLHMKRGVHVLRGVTGEELRHLYDTATVFAMPSLAEGFGQVYLEALAHGLPVIGTRNSCLPDIGGEAEGIFLSTPGQIDELAALLERLSVHLDNNLDIRRKAAIQAQQFTWTRFRSTLRSAMS
jgi:glycosyltransferase involved in cell wall biosynthesis